MEITEINNIEDIQNLTNNSDGENLYFELKGGQKLNKNVKKLLSKEICAFANTYGGIICYHYGQDTNILGFPNENIDSEYKSLETWLRDCLEPKLLGIDIKITDDNVFLIKIPESKTKPHRNASETQYYYRHSSISQKMPEILISSMYRSNSYLVVKPKVSLRKVGSPTQQLGFTFWIENLSNISGSKPKIQVQIYGDIKGRSYSLGDLKFFDQIHNGSYSGWINELHHYNIGMFSTNIELSKLILYPKDTLSFYTHTTVSDTILDINYILLRIDCMFKECERQTDYFLYSYAEDLKGKRIMGTDKNSPEEVISLAIRLIKKL